MLYYVIVVLLGLVSGCGYFSDEPVENADVAYVANVLETNCDFSSDAEKFNLIFEENISEPIDCLRSGLKTYIGVSRRNNPDFITLSELNTFINENLSLSTNDLQDKLSMFFKLGNIVLNEPRDSLSVRNIDAIFDLLKVLNSEAMAMNKAIKGAEARDRNFLKYSRDFSLAINRFSEFAKPLVSKNLQKNIEPHDVNLKVLIEDVTEGETFGNLSISSDVIDALLSFKKLFLGGDKSNLSSDEMLRFFDIGPDLTTSIFNLYFSNEEDLEGNTNYLVYFQKNLNEIAKQLYDHRNSTVIITQEEIDLVFDDLFNEMEAMEFLKPTVRQLKYNIIDGRNNYSDEYTFKNMKSLFSLADIGLESYLYFLNNESIFRATEPEKSLDEEGLLSKNDFLNATSNLAETLRLKIIRNTIFPAEVEYYKFLKFLNDEMEDININVEFLDAAIGFKTLFLGGRSDLTNRGELFTFLNKMQFIGNLYYDLSNLDLDTISKRDLYELALIDLRDFRDNIQLSAALFPVVSAKNMITIAEYILEDGKKYEQFIPLIESLKVKLVNGYEDIFTVRDFLSLSNLVEEFIEKIYFAELTFYQIPEKKRTWEEVRVKQSQLKDPGYRHFSAEKQVLYLQEFNKVINQYRYFRNDKGYSYYGNYAIRTAYGVKEVIAVKWAAELLLPKYGFIPVEDDKPFENRRKDFVLDNKSLDCVLYEFKPALDYFDLWSTSIKTFGRNILLLADLFQGQSDGTLDINAAEITEYGSLVFMAVQTGDKLFSSMINNGYCQNYGTRDNPKIENQCFRSNFFKTLMNNLGLRYHLAKLYKYVTTTPWEEVMAFLQSIERFARDDNSAYVSSRLGKIIFGAMLNIESTLIRFDQNKDNVLEFAELENGFRLYRSSVIKLAGLAKDKEKYAYGAYYFMISKKKIPSEDFWGKLQVADLTSNPPTEFKAQRLNIAKLLQNIIERADQLAKQQQGSSKNQTLEEQFAHCIAE
jgi:hypothetical protein